MPKQLPPSAAEAIISSVQKRNCLYDTRSPGYGNRSTTELAWKSVAEEVLHDIPYCKAIWASLRATFNRNLFKVRTRRKQPKWAYYESMRFMEDHVAWGHRIRDLSSSQLESDCDGGSDGGGQALEEDEIDVSMLMQPVPSSSYGPLTMTVESAPAPATPAQSTASSSPVSESSGRKRKLDDSVEQEILQLMSEDDRKPSTVASANDEQGLAVFGHLLPFYRQLPPLKQLKFLHHISGYLMDLYAESFPQ
ncbi:transcription factor adf-1 [Plakobranchus ocellatus]|uniref:Transcription factor adf-1 n=1 Tax=Plakobranchus ocellatus TaxID=259542 RepID=A0AAV4A400_9GAST|nr:transcription factor adf-1 [Plakobranchus ocellatus]